MSATSSCLVAGSVNIDEFYALPHIVRPGETIASTGYSRRGGGKGANQAVAVGRACDNRGSVKLSACIGPDGKDLLDLMVDAGVDVSGVDILQDQHTGRAIIQSSQDGENSIVLFAGANYARMPAPIAGATHVVVQNEIPFDSTLAFLRSAKDAGAATVFNPSPMPSTAQLQAFPWETIDWLLLNEGEAGDITQALSSGALKASPVIPDGLALPAEALSALSILSGVKSLPQMASVNLVCTLGAHGVLLFRSDSEWFYRPAAKLLKPLKDTTGAGDCFTGYFTAGLMRIGEPAMEGLAGVVEECLAACSMCVEIAGAAESVPARSQVLERMSLKN